VPFNAWPLPFDAKPLPFNAWPLPFDAKAVHVY